MGDGNGFAEVAGEHGKAAARPAASEARAVRSAVDCADRCCAWRRSKIAACLATFFVTNPDSMTTDLGVGSAGPIDRRNGRRR